MKPFSFVRSDSVESALAALRDGGAGTELVAGGQSILLRMKSRASTPRVLVSIGAIEELSGTWTDDGERVIGAATTYAQLGRESCDPEDPLAYVRGVVTGIADPAVRTMATIGGAACEADPAFDVPVLLVACRAMVELRSASAARRVAAADFFRAARLTARQDDEIVTSFRIPLDLARARGFAKFGLRAHDAALASVAVVADLRGGKVRAPTVVVGGCVATPTRAPQTEAWMDGRRVADAAHEIGDRLADEIEATISTQPFSSQYRRRLLVPLARRAFDQAGAEVS